MIATLRPLTAASAILLLLFIGVGAQRAKGVSPKGAPVSAGQTVTQIDLAGLKTLLKPDGKPRLINFWATWCDPCREEFPELLKIDAAYKGKLDFITVSLDDLQDIQTTVPKFLAQMKSTLPAYLLHAADEDAAIAAIAGISSDFSGSLPFTILIKPNGELAYSHQGKIHPDELRAAIIKQLTADK
jgi:thiol-disulfide isomerase/thioredoxin